MPLTVRDAFAALLEADPTATVAWTPDGIRCRADLDASAGLFEQLLAGTPVGSRVGLCVRDGFAFLGAFLACVRRGDAAMLFDAADPRAPRLDLAARFGLRAIVVDAPAPRVLPCEGRAPAGQHRAIKLTSGSTGEPNAVAVGDAELLADGAALEGTMGIGDGDRVLAAVPMSFSYGVGNLLVPALCRGRELVLPGSGPLGLLGAMRAAAPTVLPAVPALLRALCSGAPALPDSLRLVLSAGAVLQRDVAAAFRRRFTLPVHTFYGSTESGGISYDRTGEAAERGTVGRPVDGVDVTIDDDGRVVVTSPAVGTALSGCGNPAGGRFVAPDLGAFVDGELVLQGRAGDVFDVGGHKVDPREVERIIAQLDDVQDVAVLPWRDEQGRAACAAIVASDDACAERVRRHCAEVLPAAKVPRRITVVPSLPRSERGKLVREQLERLLQRDDA
ncbi:MAG: class I adenylate-forming enzyme family protein [Planctomycetota bacterium]